MKRTEIRRKTRLKSGSDKICGRCGKTFYAYPSRISSKYCSRECNNLNEKERGTSKEVSCGTCSKRFKRAPSSMRLGKQFCSQSCVAAFRETEYANALIHPKKKRGYKGRKKGVWTSKVADTRFSIWIRTRDLLCYFGCGRPAKQASHFWGRGNSGTRYDPLNVDGACGKCHMDNEGSKQGLYRDLKIKQLGMGGYIAMERRARDYMKRSDAIAQCVVLLSTQKDVPARDGGTM